MRFLESLGILSIQQEIEGSTHDIFTLIIILFEIPQIELTGIWAPITRKVFC